jgi:hypothetical protein
MKPVRHYPSMPAICFKAYQTSHLPGLSVTADVRVSAFALPEWAVGLLAAILTGMAVFRSGVLPNQAQQAILVKNPRAG